MLPPIPARSHGRLPLPIARAARRAATRLGTVALAGALLAACGSGSSSDTADSGGKITLAVDLFGTFGYKEAGLYKEYEKLHPGITVKETSTENEADYWVDRSGMGRCRRRVRGGPAGSASAELGGDEVASVAGAPAGHLVLAGPGAVGAVAAAGDAVEGRAAGGGRRQVVDGGVGVPERVDTSLS